MINITVVAGARPNFMKIAPILKAIQDKKETGTAINFRLVHTGQHYDKKMSGDFFEQLNIPEPNINLEAGGGTQAEQTAAIMVAFEKIVEAEKPDLIIVVGDVTSTLACTLVAIKMGIKVAHVEAGLRSFDRTMPEELNRILTDSVADYLFVTEESGLQHLKNEGVADERVFFSGNVMIDSLVRYQEKAKTTTILEDLGLATSDSRLSTADYIVMTMHRPANVDTKEGLESILELIELSSKDTKIIFPIHPRTRAHMEKFGLAERLDQAQNLIMTEPLGYLEFIQLMSNATAILTDSGGIQEETTYLGVPCLTFRDSTERPITVTLGTNQLLSDLDPKKTYAALKEILAGKVKKGSIPPLWDGKAAERIAAKLAEIFA